MTDEEMAEEWADWYWGASPSAKRAIKNAYLAGLKAGRPQWHKVSDGDLPKGEEYGKDSIHRDIYLKDRYGNLYTGNYYPKDKNHAEDCFAVEFLEWGFQGSQFCKKEQISEWCEIPQYTEEETMTEEELERIKQAYSSGLKVQIWFNGYWEDFDVRDYSMFPEPFSEHRQYRIVESAYADIAEKRIKELEAQIEKMKCCENCKYNSYWGCSYKLRQSIKGIKGDELVECKNMDKWEIKENDRLQ